MKICKRRRVGLSLVLGWVSIVCGCAHDGEGSRDTDYDMIITNARIVDGTGNPWFQGDVGIRGDRIASVGDLTGRRATREIDAQQRVVAPGFIDMHSHASWLFFVDPRAASAVTQGITHRQYWAILAVSRYHVSSLPQTSSRGRRKRHAGLLSPLMLLLS